ncbi:MAG: NADP-dependent malic enzyme [Planctomycetes bacterium]|nr:NADP-dependent malic enzyme [Planctomycetota bacterium]
MIRPQDALDYHENGRRGKIEVRPTKPCLTQRDLSLAYTPGVAEPCLAIQKNPDDAYRYTIKGNLVAVISNGTAVLGLGNIGALSGKPVFEGKAVLFKRFADIDVFDIEVNTLDVDEFVRTVQLISPTFGGINLEDIRAPECFEIERRLTETLDIPVFHDDQHGTAIITSAALINGLELVGKGIGEVNIVVNGAGAAAIACANLFVDLGADPKRILMCDSKGVLHEGRRSGMNRYKEAYVRKTPHRTLAQALKGADVFVGVSVANAVEAPMLSAMAPKPLIFALANPIPEIGYEEARQARPDAIVATGRSDFPNQVNNVLGYPFVFRGALDVRARRISRQMEKAASRALAALAREPVPPVVAKAYGMAELRFGPEYIIPKPFDARVMSWVAPAVAHAAIESGVARLPIQDMPAYRLSLAARLDRSQEVFRTILTKARGAPKRIVFPEGENESILKACQEIVDEGLAKPILLGDPAGLQAKIRDMGLDLGDVAMIDPRADGRLGAYTDELYRQRERKGFTRAECLRRIRMPNYFGAMMVQRGDADGVLSGITRSYADTIRPALQVIGLAPGRRVVAGLYILALEQRTFLFADTTVNIEPTAQQMAEIALAAAGVAQFFEIEPRVAFLSFSNFGSTRHPLTGKSREAMEITRRLDPGLTCDGEMQIDTAVSPDHAQSLFPFSRVLGDANILIFPDLNAGNIAYKLIHRVAGASAIGPILMGMAKPVNILSDASSVSEIVSMAALTSVEAQERVL